MAAPSSWVVSVVTNDSDPTHLKYRISGLAGEDTASAVVAANPGRAPLRPGAGVRPGSNTTPGAGGFDVGFAIVSADLSPMMIPFLGAVVLSTGTLATGTKLGGLGVVCGITRCNGPGAKSLHVEAKRYYGGIRCGAPDFVAGASGAVAVPRQTARVTPVFVKRSELAAFADGDIPINVYSLIEPEGWV